MIISASRRTDIPAFYWEWFQKRLQEQYVLVRNPLNLHQVSRISLRPEVVDGLVFWTKNPEPMLKQLSVLDAYAYYFQFTLNAYAADVEAALPPLAVRIDAMTCSITQRFLRNWQRSWPAARKNVLSVSLIIILRSRQVCIRQG